MGKGTTFFIVSIILVFSSISLFAQAPVIISEPSSRGVIEGQTATFSVSVTGDTLTFEWFKNNVAIGSSNDSIYTTPATVLADNGSEFKVVVSNSYGSDTSSVAKLYVTATGSRVTVNQIVSYIFNEATGNKVNDVAGLSPALNLTITNTSKTDWHYLDGLYIKDSAYVKSTDASAVSRVVNAIKASNEFTVEMWIRSLDLADNSKVISLSQSNIDVDFEVENFLGYNYLVRTTTTNNKGIPGTNDNLPIIPQSKIHLAFTHKNGVSKIYRDGVEVASSTIGGDLSNWTDIFGTILSLGMNNGINEWEGIYYLTSIFDRGLDSVEIAHNYSLGVSRFRRPFIIDQPKTTQVTAGDSVTFSCNVISDATPTYQWQKNGVDIPGATNSSYTIFPALPADSGSVYRVVVFNSFGNDSSDNALLKVTVNPVSAPSNLTASLSLINVNQAELSWQDNSSNELGFIVERKTGDSASVAPFTVLDTLSVDATSYIDSTLADTTTYTFRVKAYDLYTQSDYSNLASVTTVLSTIAAPTNLTAIVSPADTQNVQLNWEDNSPNELGFIIERKTGDSSSVEPFAVIDSVAADVVSYDDTTVADTTTYTYRVRGFNNFTLSDYSNLAEVTTPVPVELTSFNASVAEGMVQLNWETATELNNAGFSVQRSKDNNKFIDLAFVKGKGTTTIQSSYSFSDKSVLSGKYFYRLKQVDFNGSTTYSKSIEVNLGLPKDYALEQNYPNPFNPSTTIRFALPLNSKVIIKLYNALGQEVANILNADMDAGIHETVFNASNLSSGVYFYMLKVQGVNGSNFTSTKRMILMK
jgi:hypothetical protein